MSPWIESFEPQDNYKNNFSHLDRKPWEEIRECERRPANGSSSAPTIRFILIRLFGLSFFNSRICFLSYAAHCTTSPWYVLQSRDEMAMLVPKNISIFLSLIKVDTEHFFCQLQLYLVRRNYMQLSTQPTGRGFIPVGPHSTAHHFLLWCFNPSSQELVYILLLHA